MKTLIRMMSMALAAAGIVFMTGCESDGGDDDGGGGQSGGSVVGTWEMNEGSADTGANVSWWVFNADGTMTMYDNAGLTAKHISGTFTQDGNKVTGPFRNPGVGDGELDCTLSDDGKTMQMDFIEHWHSPYKHVPYFGTKK